MEIRSGAARNLFGSLCRHFAHYFPDLSPCHLTFEFKRDALPDDLCGGVEALLNFAGRLEALYRVGDAVELGNEDVGCGFRRFRHAWSVEANFARFKVELDAALRLPYGSRIGTRRRNIFCKGVMRLTLTGPSPSSRNQTKTGRTPRLSHRGPALTTRF